MKIVKAEQLTDLLNTEIGVSEWFDVTQEKVNTFADVTKDQQFIHVDPEQAANTPFGGTIAHGFFSLSMLSHFSETGAGLSLEGAKMGVNYGLNKVRFIHPVPVGSRIRSRSVLTAYEEKNPGQFLLTTDVTVEIEGIEKPALNAEWLGMIVV